MTRSILSLALLCALGTTAVPAKAAFYFEGLMPFTEAPNCADPFATTCGRYGAVPHTTDEETGTRHVPQAPEAEEAPKMRTWTRPGLEK